MKVQLMPMSRMSLNRRALPGLEAKPKPHGVQACMLPKERCFSRREMLTVNQYLLDVHATGSLV